MISRLSGTIVEHDLASVTLDVNGVGYRIAVIGDTLARLAPSSSRVTLFTYLAVRENAMDLYGFETADERDFFELLLTVSGIGPKSGLAILSLATIDTLKTAIGNEDVHYLTKVSGIGRKTAEKLVIGLKDKVVPSEASEHFKGTGDAAEVLQSLGYSTRESQEALREVPASITDTGERVKAALKALAQK